MSVLATVLANKKRKAARVDELIRASPIKQNVPRLFEAIKGNRGIITMVISLHEKC